MDGLIEIIEKSTKKIVQEVYLDNNIATNLLAALPDKCHEESEAIYLYHIYTIHSGVKIRTMNPTIYTTVLHKIDLSQPFGIDYKLGESVIVLSEEGLPAANGVIKAYSIIGKFYLVDVSIPNSTIVDKDVKYPASRLKKHPDFYRDSQS